MEKLNTENSEFFQSQNLPLDMKIKKTTVTSEIDEITKLIEKLTVIDGN